MVLLVSNRDRDEVYYGLVEFGVIKSCCSSSIPRDDSER
jgi:hypothetical protein